VDLGIYEGYTVPIFYDPIIAKIIVWGRSRREAILRMDRALQEFVIKGIKTTIPFHRWLVNNRRFIQGDFDTTFLDQEYFHRKKERDESFQELACIATAIRAYQRDGKEMKHGI
jgi:acetyl-CoA carboxylase biotin carboxylase subunit